MRCTFIGILVVFALMTLTAPALAGGYAVVRLDEEPGEVAVDKPFQFGFMVLQHDVTPTSDVTAVVRATNRETGEEIMATAEQEGPVGHFVAELTFPRAGEWKWAVFPEPFAETSFATLHVVDALGAAPAWTASIFSGGCADLGEAVFALNDVSPQAMQVESSQVPIAISTGTIETALPDMLAGEYAIGIGASEADAAPVACGEIANIAGTTSGDGAPDELVLGLRAGKSSRNAGVAVLREDGDRTAVTLYLLDPVGLEGALAAPAETRTIEIANDENNEWIFTPTSLQIAVGTAVVWENSSDAAHTVSGDSLAFEDSGLLEPGQSFSQIFAEPGTYHFRCAPHPWMEGTIVVS